MKKANVISWLTIISITSLALTGCNSGAEGTVSSSDAGSSQITNPSWGNNSNNGSNQVIEKPITLTRISVNANKSSVALGEGATLYATAYYSDDSHKTVTDLVTWKISEEDRIEIDPQNGEVATLTEGEATITASLDNLVSESYTLEVTAPELTQIALSVKEKSLPVGIRTEFEVWGYFTDEQWRKIPHGVAWQITNDQVVKIEAGNQINAVGEGETQIIAHLDGYSSQPVTIEVTQAQLTAIDITPKEVSMPLGTAQALTVMGTFTNGKTLDITKDVEWSQPKSEIARIEEGKIVATKIGTETIQAYKGDIKGNNVEIKVTDAIITGLQITPANTQLASGTTLEFIAKSIYSDGSEKDVTNEVKWASANYDVLTFEANKATGHKPAKTRVIATLNNGVEASVEVTVTNAILSNIQVMPTSLELGEEQVGRLRAIGEFSDGTSSDITEQVYWVSDDQQVASMLKSGLLNGIKQGQTRVTASWQGLSQTSEIKVSHQLNVKEDIALCGNKIDDDSRDTAQGECLKVASDQYGNLISAAPSVKLLNGLGYKLIRSGEKPRPYTKAYNGVRIEREGYGPTGEPFGLFNNNGLMGQTEQWCNELATKNFAGRNNWRRATRAELMNLYSKVGGSLWDGNNDDGYSSKGLGWPTVSEYWSALNMDQIPQDNYYDLVNMHAGRTFLIDEGYFGSAYPACIAPIAR
ncbi:TPA: Ig-like domain-containing protein [Vibrio cholerae]|uniref:Ig-like domain-containing protein n=1 Tax=Vibrio cholerae TaxID=666 RepID=UPI001E3F5057|nr:Ig-like domain-containing protein [Vibrio cholerae]